MFRYTTTKYQLKKASIGSAGYDICANEDTTIDPHSSKLIKTGIKIAVDSGYYAKIESRSGLAYKKKVTVEAGVIDSDYRGEVLVLLYNHSSDTFEIKNGDRIAQIVLIKIADEEFEEVSDIDKTERNTGGFGSTGVN